MSEKAKWKISIFWLDDEKMGDELVEAIFFEYDFAIINNEVLNNIDYDLNGVYPGAQVLDASNINFFEKLLNRTFDLNTYVYDIYSYGYVKEPH